MTIECKDETFRAHRVILARCRFFEVCFDREFREKADELVQLHNDEPLVIQGILTYIYTGSTNFITENEQQMRSAQNERDFVEYLVGLYLAADLYDLLNMRNHILHFLSDVLLEEAK